ncbi:MAG: hypothetical protein J7L63_04075 [Thermoplasmata archaeon]|nr:hypothetical protein [Thermoplasmata archaeon]
MNLRELKILYKIEGKRAESPVLIVVFSTLQSIFLAVILFKPTIANNVYGNTAYISLQADLVYVAIFFGITFSLLYIQELKNDYSRGIFHTFLTYPISPGAYAFSKLAALFVRVFISNISVVILFVLLTRMYFIWGIWWSIGLILGIAIIMMMSFGVSYILSPLMNLSPLPEMLIVAFFLGITFFSYTIPQHYLSLVAPFFTVAKLACGVKISAQERLMTLLSPFLYSVFMSLSYFYHNVRKRRCVE